MPTLIPMTPPEFDAFLERSVPEYAAEHVRAGNWTESESLEKSRKEFEHLLPLTSFDEIETVLMPLLNVLHGRFSVHKTRIANALCSVSTINLTILNLKIILNSKLNSTNFLLSDFNDKTV